MADDGSPAPRKVKAIQRRLNKRLKQRQASQVGTCQSCGAKQDMGPPMQTMASGAAMEMWKCRTCGGQITVMFTTFTDSGPSQDEDIATLLELLTWPIHDVTHSAVNVGAPLER